MAYDDLTEKEQVEFWRAKLDYTRSRMQPWFDAAKILEGYFSSDPTSEREADLEMDGQEPHTTRIKAGILYGWLDQTIANALDRDPVFRATAENAASVEFVDDVSKSLNYYWRVTRQLRTDERVFLDASIYPYGVTKLGYKIDFDLREQQIAQEEAFEYEFPEEENLYLTEGETALVTEHQDHRYHNQWHEEALKSPIDPPTEEGEQALKDHMKIHELFEDRQQPDSDTTVRNESVWAKRWQPDMFLVDDGAQEGLRDAKWICFDWELPTMDVQANPLYKNTDGIVSTEAKTGSESFDGDETTLGLDPFSTTKGHEIWVRNFPVSKGVYRNLLLVIADNHDSFLRNEDEWPYDRLDDFPAEVLSFHTGVRTWFNKSPLAMGGADTVQMLVNEILDSQLYVARKNKNIVMYDTNVIKDQNLVQQMLDGPDSAAYGIPGLADREMSGPPVRAFEFLRVGEEKGALLNLALSVFDRAMGTPQPQTGVNPDSATEANIIERRNTSRENRRAALLNEFQMRKAQKMWQLITQFVPEDLEEIAPDAIIFAQVTKEMAKGQYRFQLDITSQSASLALERSQGMDLINLLSGLVPILTQLNQGVPNIAELVRRLLIEGFNKKDVDEILPRPQPVQAPAGPGMGQAPGPGGNGQLPPGEGGPGSLGPQAQGLVDQITEGRNNGRGIGPANPDLMGDESAPSLGRTSGRAEGA